MTQTLIIKAIAAAVLLAALSGAWLHYKSITKDLATTKTSLQQVQTKFDISQAELVTVTADKAKFEKRAAKSTADRRKIQTNLDATLKKLRNQQPPTECKAAIEWSIENKGDLTW